MGFKDFAKEFARRAAVGGAQIGLEVAATHPIGAGEFARRAAVGGAQIGLEVAATHPIGAGILRTLAQPDKPGEGAEAGAIMLREAAASHLSKQAMAELDLLACAWADWVREKNQTKAKGATMETVREATLRLLEQYEGRRYTTYNCPAGYLTIGIGHNLDQNPLKKGEQGSLVLGDAEIDALLKDDVSKFDQQFQDLNVPAFHIFPAAREILIRMMFQMGLGGVLKFKAMLKALRDGPPNYKRAAFEMRDSAWWRTQSHDRAEDEARRMEALDDLQGLS